MSVRGRLRFEILRRDNHTCRYCGASAPEVKLTVDHVVPISLGGGDEPGNLVAACVDCNAGKSSVPPDAPLVEEVRDEAVRLAKAFEIAMAHASYARDELDSHLDYFDEQWKEWSVNGYDIPRDPKWAASVTTWLGIGFSIDDLVQFIPIAMRGAKANAGVWRYFCGCIWRELEKIQAAAARMVQEEQV